MITRRQTLTLAAGAAASPLLADALAAPARAAAPAAAGQGFDPLADALLTHVRIRGHQDGRRVFFAYHGTFYAQVTAQRTVPMFHIEGASSARMLRQPDGSYLYQLKEAGWFCDLGSHEVVAEAVNPLTGKTVRPKHYASGQRTRFTADAKVVPMDALPPGIEYVGDIGRPTADRDLVWTTEELLVRTPGAPPSGKPRVQTSLATFSANLADLERAPDAFVPCRLNYQTLGSFLAWMDMGDVPGVITWRLAGRKTDKVDELPAALRARIEREHPEVLQV
ncbi:MAG: DUF1838 domain-containing protein [Steroidobacteraceae bacterium]|jgi:hypothetical protein|nr:DUF1838 domain-containing protein [Steroidobacteraceae bacterium]